MSDAGQRGPDRTGRTVARAAVVAGVVGGVPSMVHAVVTGRDPLEALRAAGTVLAPDADGRRLLLAGAVVHAAVSAGWATVLTPVLRRAARPVATGVLLGLGVAALDLAIARRLYPRVAGLPTWLQVADHAAYGGLLGVAARRPAAPSGHPPGRRFGRRVAATHAG